MLRAGARHPDAADAAPSTSGGDGPRGVEQLYAVLHEYLQLEGKFQPKLCLSPDSEQSAEVSRGARDGAAHVMRCLKVWFDLPADVLIHAINLFDRFLTKMKVRPSHVPCITVACVDLAVEAAGGTRTVTVDELVSVSQSACTARDVRRMSRVVADKLSLAGGAPVTAVHWLRLLRALLAPAAAHQVQLQESELLNLLEITACDYACANSRASELVLVLLYHNIEKQLVEWSRVNESQALPGEVYQLFDYAVHLQNICHMSDASLMATKQLVSSVLARYEARAAAPHRQRLLWRLSERTLRVLRPTDKLTSLLPTIAEQNSSSPARDRAASESNETSDWPRSPLLPVYCDN